MRPCARRERQRRPANARPARATSGAIVSTIAASKERRIIIRASAQPSRHRRSGAGARASCATGAPQRSASKRHERRTMRAPICVLARDERGSAAQPTRGQRARPVAQSSRPSLRKGAAHHHSSVGVGLRIPLPAGRATSAHIDSQRPTSSREAAPCVSQQWRYDRAGQGQRCAASARIVLIHACEREAPPRTAAARWSRSRFSVSDLKFKTLDTIRHNHCGSLRQSGPRPDPRLLRQAALEALMRSARMNTPQKLGRNNFRRSLSAAAAARGAAAAAGLERREAACVGA
ncbi:hypothetical protein F511_19747 [Dorcoceras hygrometricum]|uniref:Uncharacterized protein n=1 Tax=Dorcoceras hygrometricum TaxID=472368 RepID=A0A2Z7B662_9LAMI|nr:hypothetical protein F511_19747 [Dorcoceras hygrometricum]